MKIESGSCRIAFVGDTVTVKVPQLKLGKVVKDLISSAQYGYFFKYITKDIRQNKGLLSTLFCGVMENYREWSLYKEGAVNADILDILVPTRFSILGLINIQDTAIDAHLEPLEVLRAIGTSISGRTALPAMHTLEGTANFGMHDGRLKIRDAGEPGLRKLMKTHSSVIKEALEKVAAKRSAVTKHPSH